MLWHARDMGLTVVEVPVTFVERARGQSKMNPAIVLEAMVRVTAWGVRSLFGPRRPKAPASGGSGSATGRSRA
jgi:dolichol-phosphate mannosyltransferase